MCRVRRSDRRGALAVGGRRGRTRTDEDSRPPASGRTRGGGTLATLVEPRAVRAAAPRERSAGARGGPRRVAALAADAPAARDACDDGAWARAARRPGGAGEAAPRRP